MVSCRVFDVAFVAFVNLIFFYFFRVFGVLFVVFRGRFVFFCSDGFDFRVFRAFSWTFNVFSWPFRVFLRSARVWHCPCSLVCHFMENQVISFHKLMTCSA